MQPERAAPTFQFRAVTPEGGVHTGTLVAPSALHAERLLLARGFRPLRIETHALRENWLHREIGFTGRRKIGVAAGASLCRELGMLIDAGIPLAEALAMMSAALPRHARLRPFLSAVVNALRLGHSLSGAIEASGYEVPANMTPIIQAGEHASSLPDALRSLARDYDETLRFKRAIVAATAYPALLLGVSVGVVTLIAFTVAPNLVALFDSMDKPPPTSIAALAGIGDFLGSNQLLTAALAAVVIASTLAGWRAIKTSVEALLLRAPGLGEAMQWSAGRQLAAILHLYLSSGVSLNVALPSALAAARVAIPKARAMSIVADVRSGARLGAVLARAKVLPGKLVHMIEIGESSGRLVEILEATLTEARIRIEQRLTLLSALLAPVLILIVGTLIGSIVFSVFSALLQINEVVS